MTGGGGLGDSTVNIQDGTVEEQNTLDQLLSDIRSFDPFSAPPLEYEPFSGMSNPFPGDTNGDESFFPDWPWSDEEEAEEVANDGDGDGQADVEPAAKGPVEERELPREAYEWSEEYNALVYDIGLMIGEIPEERMQSEFPARGFAQMRASATHLEKTVRNDIYGTRPPSLLKQRIRPIRLSQGTTMRWHGRSPK